MRFAVAECGGGKSGKVPFLRKPFEDRRGGIGNVSVMREQVAALADVDGPQLSGPFVLVAEQIAVNGLQMGEVEPALERILRKFVRTCRNEGRFGLFESGRVGDAETVFQDTGRRVKNVPIFRP